MSGKPDQILRKSRQSSINWKNPVVQRKAAYYIYQTQLIQLVIAVLKLSVQKLQMIQPPWHRFPSSLLGFAAIGSMLFCNVGQALGHHCNGCITTDRDGHSLALQATCRHFIFQSTAHNGRHQVCMHLDSAAWLAMHHSR